MKIKLTPLERIYLLLICSLITLNLSGQAIPDSLLLNTNAVVNMEQIDINILSQQKMLIQTKRMVTVLNEHGLGAIQSIQYYNTSNKIKHIELQILDKQGKEVKKVKRRDFNDHTVLDGVTLFSDSRMLYYNYLPIEYPFIAIYTCEIESVNTAFIPTWMPIDAYNVSVQQSTLTIVCPESLGFATKEINFAAYPIVKSTNTSTHQSYVAKNCMAQRNEYLSSSNQFPKLLMKLSRFHLEGVDGYAETWSEFGDWLSDNILAGTTELSEDTKTKVKALVGNEQDPLKKAALIYQYIQNKMRYVSIQVGIGGWKPMLASDVDRLGYGDCKALTNYARALLEVVGVTSYYTVVYGGNTQRGLQVDFVSMQGNHVILAIPDNEGRYVFLECTSQRAPFAYLGTFTDNRFALVVKPKGSEVVKTTNYGDDKNVQHIKGIVTINKMGDVGGQINIVSEGLQYDNQERLETLSHTDKETYYKNNWRKIGNMKIEKITLRNDRDSVKFIEQIDFSATKYATISGSDLLVNPNLLYTNSAVQRIRNRKTAFEIQRGYHDFVELKITFSDNQIIQSVPNNVSIDTPFGSYYTETVQSNPHTLIYKRSLKMQRGTFDRTQYEAYRQFFEQISKNDLATARILQN